MYAKDEHLDDRPLSEDLEGDNYKRLKETAKKRVSLERIINMTDTSLSESINFLRETVQNPKANLNARVVCATNLININLKAKKQLEEQKMAEQMYRHKELVIQVEAEKLSSLRNPTGSGYVSTGQSILQTEYVPNKAFENAPKDPSLADDYVPSSDEGLGGDTFKA